MKVIRFNGFLSGEDVFLTVYLKDLDIVSRDNTVSYNVEEALPKINLIEFMEIYDE